MKKAYILGVILIVAGILISQYPKLTDFLFRQEAKEKKEEFEKEKRNSKIKVEELYHELVKRNEALYASRRTGVRDPFLYEQNTIDLSSYGIEDGVVGFVKIDKLNVELPIYLGASEKNMSMGAAHLAETSYPVGGENTNCVIAAHRGFRKTAMLRNIQKLQVGDPVVIENFREVLKYEVSDIEIIEPSQTDKLLIRQGEDMVTLLTCHPYGSNAKRYLVYCKRVN